MIIYDNRYIEGSSTPISATDAEDNTYQIRRLSDGSKHEVIKNFPTQKELAEWIGPISEDYEYTELDYFWLARYTCKENSGQGSTGHAAMPRV